MLSDFSTPDSHTVGINFILTDVCGERVRLYDKLKIFHVGDNTELSNLIYRIELGEHRRSALDNKILLFKIFSLLNVRENKEESSIVYETVKHLSEHIDECISVSELARHCGVSEVYLRKKFKEKMGTSPAKYRNELRLNKAANYLKFGDITVQEISDTLGYATSSHFIKEFKEKYGMSPLQYRKSERE